MAEKYTKVDSGNVEEWINKIDFTDMIGHGGFGFVYRAGEKVAAKIVSFNVHSGVGVEDAEKCLKLANEHPHSNILPIYKILEDSDNKYVFMEYCELGNLGTFCMKRELTTRMKILLMTQIANGIAHLHSIRIIHRDIKPGNILLQHGEDDLTPTVKLSDFGLTKFLDESQPSTMSSDVGTIGFKAPEFWQKDRDGKLQYKNAVDVFAAGLTFSAILQSEKDRRFGLEKVDSLAPDEQDQPLGYILYVRMKNNQPIPDIISKEGDDKTLEVKSLIREMIHVNPDDRVCADEVYQTLCSISQID